MGLLNTCIWFELSHFRVALGVSLMTSYYSKVNLCPSLKSFKANITGWFFFQNCPVPGSLSVPINIMIISPISAKENLFHDAATTTFHHAVLLFQSILLVTLNVWLWSFTCLQSPFPGFSQTQNDFLRSFCQHCVATFHC